MIKEERILGVDYGEKRIGLALTDPLCTFAYAYKTIPNDKKLLINFKNIINKKKVFLVLLGMPDVKKNKLLTDIILSFKKKIEKSFKIDVIIWDEEFTSVIAQQRVIESVVKKKKRKDKGLIDQNSAAIILEEYLQSL
ncbi:MAG: Holliday junction resolvase RuvX [Ignavibacteria bacterium]|nr:Holliday junction resolvase RuvX [Ignavibacteria bacterium]